MITLRSFFTEAIFEKRAAIALFLLALTAVAMGLVWYVFFQAGSFQKNTSQPLPAAGLNRDVFEEMQRTVSERRRELEKVFQRAYPDPFVPR